MPHGDWTLWFVTLSGWPVFLALVAVGALCALGLSILFTRLSSRSVLQTALIAIASLAALAAILLGLASLMTRTH